MYLFSFAILSIYLVLLFDFFKIFKLSFEKSPKLLTLSDMVPLDAIGKDVSELFPKNLANLIKPNQDYVWATTTCASCKASLLDTSYVLNDLKSNSTLKILTTEPETSFENLHPNFTTIPIYEYITSAEMGAILYSSPCYFKIDSDRKVSDVSLNYRFIS